MKVESGDNLLGRFLSFSFLSQLVSSVWVLAALHLAVSACFVIASHWNLDFFCYLSNQATSKLRIAREEGLGKRNGTCRPKLIGWYKELSLHRGVGDD
jgi:hypothetical protein